MLNFEQILWNSGEDSADALTMRRSWEDRITQRLQAFKFELRLQWRPVEERLRGAGKDRRKEGS
ncbi:hypothetical protein D9M69_214570 [compost metagenome]